MQSREYKGYDSTELQLKNTEFAIKFKQRKLLAELRGVEFVKSLVIEFFKNRKL